MNNPAKLLVFETFEHLLEYHMSQVLCIKGE